MNVSSRIDGEFNGTNDETLYELTNGQIWQQIGYRYRYKYRYRPTVNVVRHGAGWVMIVDGFPDTIRVRRIH